MSNYWRGLKVFIAKRLRFWKTEEGERVEILTGKDRDCEGKVRESLCLETNFTV